MVQIRQTACNCTFRQGFCAQILTSNEGVRIPLGTDHSRSLSTRIVEEVAAEEGVEPSNIERQLYDVIDADALKQTIESMEANGIVCFDYSGYRVYVAGDGDIKVSNHNSLEEVPAALTQF